MKMTVQQWYFGDTIEAGIGLFDGRNEGFLSPIKLE